MELFFLGTGAGSPSRERNVTSIALDLTIERGKLWLFDCGEGTQHQILKSSLKLSRLEYIFITHLHGDHIYGLPGLLTSKSYQGGNRSLTLYGPPGIRSYMEHVLSISQARLDYEWNIIEVEPGIVLEDEQFIIETAPLEHRIESYGYRITEKPKLGKLLSEKLKEEGVSPGPIYAEIKKGKDQYLPDGRLLKAADYVTPPTKGRIVTIMGDTRICEGSRRLSRQADVLVHEATFASDKADLAYKYFHSTSEEVARMAKEEQVGTLIMTHISSRYQGTDIEKLLEEARKYMKHAYVAKDFWSMPISLK